MNLLNQVIIHLNLLVNINTKWSHPICSFSRNYPKLKKTRGNLTNSPGMATLKGAEDVDLTEIVARSPCQQNWSTVVVRARPDPDPRFEHEPGPESCQWRPFGGFTEGLSRIPRPLDRSGSSPDSPPHHQSCPVYTVICLISILITLRSPPFPFLYSGGEGVKYINLSIFCVA